MKQRKDIGEAPDCLCGCGQKVNRSAAGYAKWNKYIAGHGRKGIKFTTEHKQNIKDALAKCTKRKLTPEEEVVRREKIRNTLTGSSRPDDVKLKIARTLKVMFENAEDHPAYIDGRSFVKYGRDFNNGLKSYIKHRDSNTCQYCGNKEGRMDVHHINYIKKDNRLENLILLCSVCHARTNKKYTPTRILWKIILKHKMAEKNNLLFNLLKYA